MTFDVTSNSPCVSQGSYKAIQKENLAVYQKSLGTFFIILSPPQRLPLVNMK